MIPFGGEATQDFRLTGAGPGAVLTLASGGDPDLRIETLAGKHGLNPEFRIHASGRTVGFRVGTLLVATGLPAPHQVPLLYSLRVEGTLRIAPTNPIVDLSARDAKATFVDVASAQANFAVMAVEIEKGPFAVIVDALTDANVVFYESQGFTRVPGTVNKLFLAASTLVEITER